ncbi:ribonuclease H-like domain-containing protein, partial [Tanacetum coccineum]
TIEAASVPAGSRNRPASVPAGSRNRPTSVPTVRPFSADRELLLSPQQVVFGEFKGEICNGDPRTMDNPHKNKDLGIVDSGCSRSMTGNKEKLDDFVKIVGGTVTFGGGDGKITRKGTIRTSQFFDTLEMFYYVAECHLFAWPKASFVVVYTKWHRRMAHVNFKNMNKLAKHGLVNGLPSKLFTNEHNYVACNKGKQHKASYKAITAVSTIFAPLHLLHMDLFGLLQSEH